LPPGTASLAGSFPRSFLIPGTDTSILIGGQVTFDAGYWISGGVSNNDNGVVPSVNGIALLSSITLSSGPGSSAAARNRDDNVLLASPYASRLHFETRTPTAFGEADTVIEFDFLGCASANHTNCSNNLGTTNSIIPRLRLAYATLGPFMAGQNWAVGFDLAASPETFDTGGIPGQWGPARVPEVTYTMQLPTMVGPAALEVGLVTPESSAGGPWGGTLASDTSTAALGSTAVAGLNGGTPAISTNPLHTTWPDLAAALTFQQPWGHLQFKGVVTDQILDDGSHLDQQYIGYGGGISGNVQPHWLGWEKDNFGFNTLIGDGLGRWAEGGASGTFFPALATNYGSNAALGAGGLLTATQAALAASTGNTCAYGATNASAAESTAACASGVRATTIPEWGAEVNYQHWWTPTIRSTADVGILYQDVPTSIVGTAADGGPTGLNKTLVLSHVNLIWSPVPFVNTGFEFVYGHRQTIQNATGNEYMVDYEFTMKF
ncbi:MAG TPA: porin, partial [Stellaceae bacterium]|nr:porin [Stellaceae bacterium]